MLDEMPTIGTLHLEQRKRLTDRHNRLMEKLMKDNSHKSKYWILGTARTKRKGNQTTITPSLEVLDYAPEIMKEAYLYEVDNTLGTKTLVWVMHPNDKLSLPSIGKFIHVAGDSSV